MQKTDLKRKEPVKLRQRLLANGNYTLYLDIYWKGQREYDYLNLYLTEAKTPSEKEQNKIHCCWLAILRRNAFWILRAGNIIYSSQKPVKAS